MHEGRLQAVRLASLPDPHPLAVKPEGGGSDDGSDMEAEPGIPLKVDNGTDLLGT